MNPAGERFLQSCAQQYLGERDIVELTLSIGWWGRVARALVPLEVEIDEQAVGSTGDLIGRRAVREQGKL